MKTGVQLGTKAAELLFCASMVHEAEAALRHETFDREPAKWGGINHRNAHFEARKVEQDFGYNPNSRRAGGQPGEVGGRLNPAGEPAFYAWRLPKELTFDSELSAEGKVFVAPGPGHFLLGFFNAATLKEWRTANSLVVRINSRGENSHFHFEYCTSKWRANAGVIGEITPGERISAKEIPNGQVLPWKLAYAPKERSVIFTLGETTAKCELQADHRADGATFTHFGLMPIPKTWDSPGELWIDDVRVNGVAFDFATDPKWEALNNRRTYLTKDTRPKFDFGWNATHFAQGQKAGELGGLIFRGDCREPARLAAYGDSIGPLTLQAPFEARGRVAMLRGISDSTASIGFYHSAESLRVNPSQQHSIPLGFLGINIEGPSSEGFFFYPVCRLEESTSVVGDYRKAPRIYPDGKSREWSLRYEPQGNGRVSVTLDDQSFTMELPAGRRTMTFDRFGIVTPWIDGNSVTAYFDDLTYTNAQE
jgi:hypothetical protein